MTNVNMKMKEQKPSNDENLGSFYMGRMKPSTPPRRVLPKGALTFTTLFAFAAILWYAYPRGQERYSDIDIPVIAADKTVYKFKPDDPGGMEVLHQDSTVFDPLEKKSADTVEKVRPKPEEPMVKPEAAKTAPIDKTPHNLELQEVSHGAEKIISAPEPAPVKKEEPKVEAKAVAPAAKPAETPKVTSVKTETKAQPAKAEAAKASAKTEATTLQTAQALHMKAPPAPLKGEAVPAVESVKAEPLSAPFADKPDIKPGVVTGKAQTQTKPVMVAAASKPAAAPVKAAAKSQAKPAASSDVMIQFGAYRENKGAQEQWALLQKKFPDQVKGLVMRTTIVTGKKGALTHLQAGRVSETRAKEICDKLQAAKEACMIVHE